MNGPLLTLYRTQIMLPYTVYSEIHTSGQCADEMSLDINVACANLSLFR